MRKRSPLPVSRHSRRHLAWVVLSGGLLLIGGFMVISHLLWQWHGASIKQQQHVIRLMTNATFFDTNLSVETFNGYTETLADKRDLCKPPLVTAPYRLIVPSAAKTHQECLDYAKRLQATTEAAQTMNTLLADDAAFAYVLKKAQKELSALKPDQFKEMRTVWQEASRTLGELPVSDGYQPMRNTVQASIGGIVKGFIALEKANAAKQRTDFDNAVVELGKAYDRLAKASAIDDAQIEALVRHASEL